MKQFKREREKVKNKAVIDNIYIYLPIDSFSVKVR